MCEASDKSLAPNMQRGADDRAGRMAELEHLLNDPDVPIEPDRVWTLVFEIAGQVCTTNMAAA